MDVDRLVERARSSERILREFPGEARQAYWEGYDEAQQDHETAFIRAVKNGITDKTGMDDKQIAARIGVSPAAICTWQKNGKVRAKNLQRLVDLAEINGVEMPDVEPLIKRIKAAIRTAMIWTLEKGGETTACDLNDDLLEWLWRAPFEDWSIGPGDEHQLNGIYRTWLAEFPGTRNEGSPCDLFHKWVPAYIACREAFNPEPIEEDQ